VARSGKHDLADRGAGEKLAKRAKHNDAVMTGILVTRFKMGQIDINDLEEMVADESRVERCSAAKKVLEAVREMPDPSGRRRSFKLEESSSQKC